jgi:hypothetical protein
MAKKVWVSFPLTTSCDARDASVVTFLKGGQKKELEVETATFITKWLMDKDVPFGMDFDSAGVDRALVIESLPKRLQKILSATVPAVADPGEGMPSEQSGAAEQTAEVERAAAIEEAAHVEEPGAVVEAAKIEEVGAELPGRDTSTDGSSELR